MRSPQDVPRQRGRGITRGRIWIVVGIIVLFLLLTSLRGIAVFYTDYLWFSSVHLTTVWKGVLGTKIGLAVVFCAIFFAGMWASLAIADRIALNFSPLGPEDELVRRYRNAVRPRARLVRTIAAVILALLVGTGASGQWHNWILFRNSVPFGVKDPQFHMDVGFYVFKLPFLSFLVGWAFLALMVILVITVVAHYLNGGIRFQGPGQRVNPLVKVHISVLLALIALVKAAGYFLQRYTLTTSTRGFVQGATYTDVHAQLPALTLLIFISLAAFVIFLVNIRRRGWVLPVIGVGLWAFISVVVGAIYPAFIQTFKVQPSQNSLERPYIARNINATRTAMNINNVQYPIPFSYSQNLTPAELASDLPTLSNVRLWDPNFATQTYEKLQDIRSYYLFNELALDRYQLNGANSPVITAVRQLNQGDLPSQSWVNSHLQFTHGYGAVLGLANQANPDGNPLFAIQDVPPVSTAGAPIITQPSVYFGLNNPGYVIADTKQAEIDFQKPSGANQESTYHGSGGVEAGSVVRRAAFALRFADINPLISGQVSSHSRVMFVRDIRDMVNKAAPFLHYDNDPYPVVLNGRIYWVQDAYTTTDRYPYAQNANTSALNGSSGLNTSFNYVRNSVKVLIDAYNGTMTFYQMDAHDPLANAYAKAFPHLFTPASKMSPELRAHLRYPEDIFTVQAAAFGRYHITNANQFYAAGDAWDLSQDPGSGSPSAALQTTATTNAQGFQVGPSRAKRMAPIYQLTRLPGQSQESFNLLEPFVPVSTGDTQQNLTGFMVADSDPDHYGQLQAYVTPRGQQIDGPALIDARIAAVTQISQQISLLNQQGSNVLLGNVLMIPIDQSLLYIRPLYVQSSRNPLPEFKKIIVVYGNQAAMEDSLSQALADLFGAPVPGLPATSASGAAVGPTTPITPSSPGGGVSATVSQLLAQAQAAYAQAQNDLKAGDLGKYQTDINQAGDLLNQASQAASASAAPSTPAPSTTTPSTTAPPAPTTGSTNSALGRPAGPG
ncbi:MAG TPA: UPF0182 family protein [Acidimicrobiales bacterium]|nr:UPF0182 family protein [Acidimicrobiales bacterium]